jgi:dipeptidyl aminopeptidase/acylaminoacyl peptidase
VPIDHGTKFHDAVSRTNKDVEWVVYNQEGHGLRQDEHRIDYWTRVETLLKRCLKSPAGAAPNDPAGPGNPASSPQSP